MFPFRLLSSVFLAVSDTILGATPVVILPALTLIPPSPLCPVKVLGDFYFWLAPPRFPSSVLRPRLAHVFFSIPYAHIRTCLYFVHPPCPLCLLAITLFYLPF